MGLGGQAWLESCRGFWAGQLVGRNRHRVMFSTIRISWSSVWVHAGEHSKVQPAQGSGRKAARTDSTLTSTAHACRMTTCMTSHRIKSAMEYPQPGVLTRCALALPRRCCGCPRSPAAAAAAQHHQFETVEHNHRLHVRAERGLRATSVVVLSDFPLARFNRACNRSEGVRGRLRGSLS